MIIECTNCHKKFNVESSLISRLGRNIQCGSCNHIWFYKEKENTSSDPLKINPQNILNEEKNDEIIDEEKNDELVDEAKYKENIKSNTLNFNKILSYLIVGIISFTAFIIILDTPKAYSDYSKNQYRILPRGINENEITHDSAHPANSINVDMVLDKINNFL